SRSVIDTYLSDPGLRGIEALLLACTHYPLIKQEILDYYDQKIPVLDSTAVTALALQAELKKQDLLCAEKLEEDRFFVSDYSENFLKATRLFYPENIHLEKMNIWE
ncbi:MAG TPA: glutamate racemase, partial [Saprospiraceae bacterium]|nr:glutamate racemase [Saprospiraceae bacterium]